MFTWGEPRRNEFGKRFEPRVGDAVRLRSAGPLMPVTRADRSLDGRGCEVRVTWAGAGG